MRQPNTHPCRGAVSSLRLAAALFVCSCLSRPVAAARLPASAPAAVGDGSGVASDGALGATTHKVADRFKDPLGKLLASAGGAKRFLIVAVPDPAGEPDRPVVLDVVRAALMQRAAAAGLHPIRSARADAEFTIPRGAALPPAFVKALGAKEGLLPAGETFDAVLYATCATRRGARTVHIAVVNDQKALGPVETVTLGQSDLADLPKVGPADLEQAEDEVAAELQAATAGSAEAAKAFPKVAVVVAGAGPGGGRAAEIVREQLIGLLAPAGPSASPNESSPADAGPGQFDTSAATQAALASAKRGPLMTPAEAERALKGTAYQAILSVACSQGGGKPATVEFALLGGGKSVAWRATVALNDWALAGVPAVPLINQKIVRFAQAHLRQQVGNGECWTLAAEALQEAGARRAREYSFGRALAAGEAVLPGDIMQFTAVRLEGRDHWAILGRPHHTAVIEQVLGERKYKVLHQNSGDAGKTVSEATLDMAELKSGSYQIFRPEKKTVTEPAKSAGT